MTEALGTCLGAHYSLVAARRDSPPGERRPAVKISASHSHAPPRRFSEWSRRERIATPARLPPDSRASRLTSPLPEIHLLQPSLVTQHPRSLREQRRAFLAVGRSVPTARNHRRRRTPIRAGRRPEGLLGGARIPTS